MLPRGVDAGWPRTCLKRTCLHGRRRTPVVISLVFCLTSASGAHEVLGQDAPRVQYVVSSDVVLASRFMWRGLTRSNHWVVQPDLYATVGKQGWVSTALDVSLVAISTGVWANVELMSSAPGDLSDLGAGQRGLSEVNPWVQFTMEQYGQEFTAGFTSYFYLGDASRPASRNSEANTSEFYAAWRVVDEIVEPTFGWWFDPFYTMGSYVETGLLFKLSGMPLPIPRAGLDPFFGVVHLGVVAGWSAGQAVNLNKPTEGAHFVENGLTHVEFSLASSMLVAKRWFIEPSLHLQINHDEATRRLNAVPLESDHGLVWWFTVVLSPVALLGNGFQ